MRLAVVRRVEGLAATVGGARVGHLLVDLGSVHLAIGALAQEVEEGLERLRARAVGLPAVAAPAVLRFALRPVVHADVLFQAVRRVRQHVGIGHAAPAAAPGVLDLGHAVAQEGGGEADHVALAVAHHRDGHVRLLPADRLDQLGQPQRRQHAIGARRGTVERAVGRVHALQADEAEGAGVEPLMPQVRQGGAAVGERTTAPIVLLVQEDLVAELFQLFLVGLVAPAEVDGR